MVCIAKFSGDDKFYRASVIKLIKNRKVRVKFVDYGNSEVVEAVDLRKIMDKYLVLPIMAVEVALDINQVGITWSEEATQFVREKVTNRIMRMIVTQKRKKDRCKVMMYERKQNDSVNYQLIQEGYGITTEFIKNEDLGLKKDQLDFGNNILSQNPQVDTVRGVRTAYRVISAISPAKMNLRRLDQEESFYELSSFLASYYNYSSVPAFSGYWQIGSYGVVRWDGEGLVRAKVLNIGLEGIVELELIDYGVRDMKTLELMRPLADPFCMPPYSCTVHLAKLLPAGGGDTWTLTACEKLQDILWRTSMEVEIEVVGDIVDNSWPVVLYIQEKDDNAGPLDPLVYLYKSVGDLLVEDGLAFPLRMVTVDSVAKMIVLEIIDKVVNTCSTDVCDDFKKVFEDNFPNEASITYAIHNFDKFYMEMCMEEVESVLKPDMVSIPNYLYNFSQSQTQYPFTTPKVSGYTPPNHSQTQTQHLKTTPKVSGSTIIPPTIIQTQSLGTLQNQTQHLITTPKVSGSTLPNPPQSQTQHLKTTPKVSGSTLPYPPLSQTQHTAEQTGTLIAKDDHNSEPSPCSSIGLSEEGAVDDEIEVKDSLLMNIIIPHSPTKTQLPKNTPKVSVPVTSLNADDDSISVKVEESVIVKMLSQMKLVEFVEVKVKVYLEKEKINFKFEQKVQFEEICLKMENKAPVNLVEDSSGYYKLTSNMFVTERIKSRHKFWTKFIYDKKSGDRSKYIMFKSRLALFKFIFSRDCSKLHDIKFAPGHIREAVEEKKNDKERENECDTVSVFYEEKVVLLNKVDVVIENEKEGIYLVEENIEKCVKKLLDDIIEDMNVEVKIPVLLKVDPIFRFTDIREKQKLLKQEVLKANVMKKNSISTQK